MSLNKVLKHSWLIVLLVGLGVLSALAGSAVVGSVAGSLNATIGGQALEPNTTLFSGDSLQVKDGAAVIALGAGSRMVFGRETAATFLREADAVTVTLKAGNVTMYHPETGTAVRVKIGELVIEPGKGYATEGEVAMLGGSVVVTAKEGTLRVAGGKRAMEVKKGQTMTIRKVAGAPGAAPTGTATSEGITPTEVFSIVGGVAGGTAAGFSIANYNSGFTCTPAVSPSTTGICTKN
jgi:hypothetical protein